MNENDLWGELVALRGRDVHLPDGSVVRLGESVTFTGPPLILTAGELWSIFRIPPQLRPGWRWRPVGRNWARRYWRKR